MVFKTFYRSFKRILNYIKYLLLLIVCFVQSKKPGNKHLLTTWRLECELGIVIDSDCPIDGSWSPWTQWSTCFGTCDNVGYRKRIRECNNPLPSKDGLPCSGLDHQIETCYLKNCSVDDFRAIVKGDFARSEALRQLEAIPAFMERCLQMECPYEAVEIALDTENTWQLNSEALWNALQCVKHDLGCSVNGEWGAWGKWSACGAQCGKGIRWRIRRCDTPPPSVSHLVCLGTPLQKKECEGDQCAIDGIYSEFSVGGSWSEWTGWTRCSEKCGSGIRRRKRTCIEKNISNTFVTWTTHCRGQYEELESCNIKKCELNGGWSGWGAWGPCSQTCGAGKKSRTRSCTRPIPSGGGSNCLGPKVDVGSCHLTPCEVYSHMIAAFNGDSVLQYDFPRKRSTFFHFYMRFMPLSPHGTLIRRGTLQNARIRVSLHKWHICIDVSGSSTTCILPRTCSPSALESSVWHSILLTVTNEVVIIRVDDGQVPIQSSFLCNPELTNDQMNIFLGERMHGGIQEIILNFMPISIFIEHEQKNNRTNFFPTSASNMAYEKANTEEAYIYLANEQYLRVPCFKLQNEWQLELTIKSKRESGIILFFSNYNNNMFYIMLHNMHLKIKFITENFKSEATSSTECLPNQWLDIKLNKRSEGNTIEVCINAGEHLHVLLTDDKFRKQRHSNIKNSKISLQNNASKLQLSQMNECRSLENDMKHKFLCKNEYFIGGIPLPLKNKMSEDFAPFYGVIASLKVNSDLLDLHNLNMEKYRNGMIQLSSRTASISGSYQELSWGKSNKLNLICVHYRNKKSNYPAYWFYLDTVIENKNMCSTDDGKVLRIIITAINNRPGFYTCRANDNKRTRNFVTYGILGKNLYKFSIPDTLTIVTLCTTVSLVIFTIAWLIIEGYHDIRDGYGFFRDDQLSSEEPVENNNDQNMRVICSESTFTLARTKGRRRKNRRLRSQVKLESQENLNRGQEESSLYDCTPSEPEELPALPEIRRTITKPSHEIYRCEPSNVSSALDSNNSSLKTKLFSSSLDISPRRLCSRLLFTKYKNPSKDLLTKKSFSVQSVSSNFNARNKPKLLAIKYSNINNPPVQKVLKKFQDLKSTENDF